MKLGPGTFRSFMLFYMWVIQFDRTMEVVCGGSTTRACHICNLSEI